jgi:hypothetical protein
MIERDCRTCDGTGRVKDYSDEGCAMPECDINGDGVVDAKDLGIVRRSTNWNKRTAPAEMVTVTSTLELDSWRTYENIIIAVQPGVTAISAMHAVHDVTLRNVIAHGLILFGYEHHRNVTLEDVTIPASADKGLMIGGENLTLRRVVVSGTMSHTARLWWLRDSLIEDCDFGPPLSGGRACLKLHAAQAYKGGGSFANDWVPGPSENNLICRTQFQGSAPWACTVGPQDGEHYEIVRDTRFESCEWLPYEGNQCHLRISGPDNTVEACKFDMSKSESWGAGVYVEPWGIGPQPTGCKILGCEAIDGRLTRPDKVLGDTVVR